MIRKRKVLFCVFIISILTFLFSLVASATEIEIKPVLEGKEYYIMNMGESQAFEALGFGWDNQAKQKTLNAQITTVKWSFDARFLELLGQKGNSITLKAIKERTSKLTVIGEVDNKQVSKTIFIVIQRNKSQVNK